jgi:hypothetical protein
MSRTFLYDLLRTDAALSTPGTLGNLGVLPDSIYAAEAADDIKHYPFITMRWNIVAKGIGDVTRQSVDVWAHDRDRDYLQIDAILKRVKVLCAGVQANAAVEGSITQIDWQSDSPDLRDDGYDTVTRNSTYTLIGSTR